MFLFNIYGQSRLLSLVCSLSKNANGFRIETCLLCISLLLLILKRNWSGLFCAHGNPRRRLWFSVCGSKHHHLNSTPRQTLTHSSCSLVGELGKKKKRKENKGKTTRWTAYTPRLELLLTIIMYQFTTLSPLHPTRSVASLVPHRSDRKSPTADLPARTTSHVRRALARQYRRYD